MRRYFVGLVFVLCLAGAPKRALAQIALVQSTSQTDLGGGMWTTGSLDQTLTFSSPVTVGNTVGAWTLYGNLGRTMNCTLDGNAMTEVLSGNTASNMIVRIYGRVATSTGQNVVCTISANDILTQQFCIGEFSGTAATLSTAGGAGVTAPTASETASGTSHDSGADITPDTAHNLFLGGLYPSGNPGTITDMDGFTAIASDAAGICAYRIQTSATAQDWVVGITNSRTTEIGITNLDGAAGGGGGGGSLTAPSGLTTLGVGR